MGGPQGPPRISTLPKLGLIVAKNADFRIFAGVNPFFDYVIDIFKQWAAIIYILKLSGHA